MDLDNDLVGHIFIVDGEQGHALASIIQQGVRDRSALYEDLNQRDFYFSEFYRPEPEEPEPPAQPTR